MPHPRSAMTRAMRAAAAERRTQGWELRKAGASYRAIAQRLGVSHEQVRKDCDHVLDELSKQAEGSATKWRALQLERCEDVVLGLWQAVRKGDTESVNALMRVFKRQADLLGLDAPKRSELSGPDGGAIQIEQDVTYSVEERQRRIVAIVDEARGRLNPFTLGAGSDLDTARGSTDEGLALTG